MTMQTLSDIKLPEKLSVLHHVGGARLAAGMVHRYPAPIPVPLVNSR